MRLSRIAAMLVGLAAAAAVGAGVTYAARPTEQSGPTALPNPATAARTRFPGLVSATGKPTLTGLSAVKPKPGSVARVTGPFDDRFRIEKLVFDGSRVSGRVRITSDVSDILELETLAGFYGSDGRLLGTNRFVYHLVEESQSHTGPPSEVQTFTIAVPTRLRGRAVSAAVGVPVLVNE